MNTHIYILTDSNRTCLHVVELPDTTGDTIPDPLSNASRVVYQESLTSEESARKRFEELSRYTRMQKERLIRKHNPNWMNLNSPRLFTDSRVCV